MFVCRWPTNGLDRSMSSSAFTSLWERDQPDRTSQNYLRIYWTHFCVLNADKQIYVKSNCIKLSTDAISP